MGIHSRARPTIASLLVSSGNGYENECVSVCTQWTQKPYIWGSNWGEANALPLTPQQTT